jgi:hypothetical protein
MKRYYDVSDTSLILTRCPFYDCTVGGYYCINCRHFITRNKTERFVYCGCAEGTPKQQQLPPQRKTKQ